MTAKVDDSRIAQALFLTVMSLQLAGLGAVLQRLAAIERGLATLSFQTDPYVDISPSFVPSVSPDDDPAMGPADAGVLIVGFEDYQCPACKAAVPVIDELMAEFSGDVRFVFRDFPLESHPMALKAGLAAECAGSQGKYWEMYRSIFTSQDKLSDATLAQLAEEVGLEMPAFAECYSEQRFIQEIEGDLSDGLRYGVAATPTFFVNGFKVEGPDVLVMRELVQMSLGKEAETTQQQSD